MSREHVRRSKCFKLTVGDTWWYNIPPIGKTYKPGDTVVLRLLDYQQDRPARFTFMLDSEWLKRIRQAGATADGDKSCHIRRLDGSHCALWFGSRKYDIEVELE